MASGDITFSQVSAGRVMERVVVRLMRHWQARNVKKGGQLMALELLFVDEKSTVVHASIGVPHIPYFESLLKDGQLYVLSCFDVSKSNAKYRMCDFPLSLRLSASTTLLEIGEHLPEIPKQVFRFRSYQDMLSLAKTSFDMPDVIGQVCYTKEFYTAVTNVLEKLIITVRLESGEDVRVTAFDSHAPLVAKSLKDTDKVSCVVLATNVNPKFFAGSLYLNSTAATKFFLNDEVEATRQFTERLQKSNSVQKFRRVQKVEVMTIADMNKFILTAQPQEIEFICSATIISIETKRGWNFISCSTCGKKLQQVEATLTCKHCNTSPVVGNARYRVEVAVEDHTESAVFVLFDLDMQKLTNIDASTLTAQQGEAKQKGEAPGQIPAVIMGLIGRTFTFQLRLTDFNFTTYHQSFTVSRVFTDGQSVPTPHFSTEEPADSNTSETKGDSTSVIPDKTELAKPNKNKKKQRIA